MRGTFHGKQAELQALGQTWRLSRFEMDSVLDAFTDWARKQLPDPLEVARVQIEKMAREEIGLARNASGTPVEKQEREDRIAALKLQQERILESAMTRATSYLAWQGAEMKTIRESHRGAAQLLYLLLRKHHPEIGTDTALNILMDLGSSEAGQRQLRQAIQITMGQAPPAVEPEKKTVALAC